MKNIINYLKRYYKCVFDYNLFQTYLKESSGKALLFLVPLFLIFTFQSYFSAISNPTEELNQFQGLFEHISLMTNDDVLTSAENGDLKLEASFAEGEIQLEQDKLYDSEFTYDGKSMRLIVDTHNSKSIEADYTNKYSTEVKNKFGYKTADMVTYISKDYIIINSNDVVTTYNLSTVNGEEATIYGMYLFIQDVYLIHYQYFVLALLGWLFIFTIYYVVGYFTIKSLVKRKNVNLSKSNLKKIVAYSLQAGMYVFLILNLIDKLVTFSIFVIIPLCSMMTMYYVGKKTVDNLEAYFVKEKRKARKGKSKPKS